MQEIGNNDPVFMPDNSSVHTCKLTCLYLKEHDWILHITLTFIQLNMFEATYIYIACK